MSMLSLMFWFPWLKYRLHKHELPLLLLRMVNHGVVLLSNWKSCCYSGPESYRRIYRLGNAFALIHSRTHAYMHTLISTYDIAYTFHTVTSQWYPYICTLITLSAWNSVTPQWWRIFSFWYCALCARRHTSPSKHQKWHLNKTAIRTVFSSANCHDNNVSKCTQFGRSVRTLVRICITMIIVAFILNICVNGWKNTAAAAATATATVNIQTNM